MEKSDKLVIRKQSKFNGHKPLNIDVDTHRKLLKIKETSGVPIARLVAHMVDFCAERIVVEEG